jgi:hypothetical protein
MTRLRRALAPVAVMWLSCQVGTVALVPVALWVSHADTHKAECTCGHGAGAMCPMHHHKPVPGRSSDCSMQAAHEPSAVVLASIIGIAGLIPGSTPSLVAPVPSNNVIPAGLDVRGERPVPPDPPPPRV